MVLPRRDEHALVRSRLLDRLDELPALTLIRGSAGAGKTDLVTQWAARAGVAGETVSWFDGEVDRSHDVVEMIAHDMALTLPSGLSVADALTFLTRQLRKLDRRCVWVFDAFDPLAAELGTPLMGMLRRCSQLHMVLCTRQTYDFMWDAILNPSHQIIDQHDLAFTAVELQEYAAGLGVEQGTDQATEIVALTGGMPALVRAGIELKGGLSMRDGDSWWSSADVRTFVADRARQLVVADQMSSVGLVSYLPGARFDVISKVLPDRFAALLSAWRGAGMVNRSSSGNLTLWMPPIVSEVLRSGHDFSTDPELAAASIDVIGELERSGRVIEALELAQLADRPDVLFDLIKEHWWDVMAHDPGVLAAALMVVPEDIAQQQPLLMRYFAELMPDRPTSQAPLEPLDVPSGDDELRAAATDAEASTYLAAIMLELMSARMRGDLAAALDDARRGAIVATVISENAGHELPVGVRRFFVQVGLIHLHCQDLDAAEAAFRHGYGQEHSGREDVLRREAANKLALVRALQGDHDGTRAWIARAAALPEPTGWLAPLIESPGHMALAIVAIDELNQEGARRHLAALSATIATDELWFVELGVLAAASLVWGGRLEALNDLQLARVARADLMGPGSLAEAKMLCWAATLLTSLGRGTEAHVVLALPRDAHRFRVEKARLLVLTGDLVEAQAVIASVTRTTHRWTRMRLEALLLSAQVHHELGEGEMVLSCLRSAVKDRRFVSTFLSVPREVFEPWAGQLPELAEILDVLDAHGARQLFPHSVKVIALTERERELLELLPTRQSRDTIARRLFVSTNTVKTQLRALYRKLGVTSREQAVTQAYELGLLS